MGFGNEENFMKRYMQASSNEYSKEIDNEVRLIDANRLIRTLRELGWINDNPYVGDNILEEIINNEPTIKE